ncbi:endonuclease V [Halogeometricum borinquense]|uniref:Endonuclease V n=1 Tax=Halogeometricum borinquense TaxID=60847 RepID=A0A6C0UDC6_9EURY|nr:endonuclease V [Halogeometricum borinquense]QIB73354.1 endonuclease V [Halogeometricum borinquense]QIQ77248.1 endonuclease V [Halogeometricum borinquense]
MDPVRPEFLPDPALSRDEMEALQYDVADAADWSDAFDFDAQEVSLDGEASLSGDRPLVAGVDQAFLDDRGVSAIVVARGDTVVERVHAVTDLEIPYIPGLLSFREGGPIVAAFEKLSCDPDLLVFDGSGRIHFRQAGLATHLGVVFDKPSVGVAKSLLCGHPTEDVDGRPEGWRAEILADDSVENADSGEPIGHAFQSRQYDTEPIINPLYVSPGHRVSVPTATTLVSHLCGGYKLPEPTRQADTYADDVKAEYQ